VPAQGVACSIQPKHEKAARKERLLIKLRAKLTLTGLKRRWRFVDYVNAAFATHNAAVTMPILERAERLRSLPWSFSVSWPRASAGLRAAQRMLSHELGGGDTGINQ